MTDILCARVWQRELGSLQSNSYHDCVIHPVMAQFILEENAGKSAACYWICFRYSEYKKSVRSSGRNKGTGIITNPLDIQSERNQWNKARMKAEKINSKYLFCIKGIFITQQLLSTFSQWRKKSETNRTRTTAVLLNWRNNPPSSIFIVYHLRACGEMWLKSAERGSGKLFTLISWQNHLKFKRKTLNTFHFVSLAKENPRKCKINHPMMLWECRENPFSAAERARKRERATNSKTENENEENFKMYLLSHADYVRLNLFFRL